MKYRKWIPITVTIDKDIICLIMKSRGHAETGPAKASPLYAVIFVEAIDSGSAAINVCHVDLTMLGTAEADPEAETDDAGRIFA